MKESTALKLPKCDFCPKKASYEGITIHGTWSAMCSKHFNKVGTSLGLGKGQRLIVAK